MMLTAPGSNRDMDAMSLCDQLAVRYSDAADVTTSLWRTNKRDGYIDLEYRRILLLQ